MSAFAPTLNDDADAAAARATLGLGGAAVKPVGTSGDAVPVLNGGAPTFAAGATFGGNVHAGGFDTFGAAPGTYGLFREGTVTRVRAGGAATIEVNGVIVLMPTDEFLSPGADGIRTLGAPSVQWARCFVSTAYFLGGHQVVGPRKGGWSVPGGTASRAGFDPASVTLEELAQRVKALIDDLTAHGLIGA